MKISKLIRALIRSTHICVIAMVIAGSATAGERTTPRTESATVTSGMNPDLSGVVDLYLDGRIDGRVMPQLNRFAYLQGRKGVILHLNSYGGSMRDGLLLGRRIRELGFTTQVSVEAGGSIQGQAGICESACVLLFAGGRFRLIQPDSSVGVHQFAATDQVDSQEAMADAQIFSAATVNFFRDMGVSTQLFSLMAITPAHEMQTLSVADQVNLGLVNAGKEDAVWNVESDQGGALVLKGVQSTISSTVEVQISCTSHQAITMTLMVNNGVTMGVSSADLLIDARNLMDIQGQPVRESDQSTIFAIHPGADQLPKILGANAMGVRLHHVNQRQSVHTIDVPAQASALMAGFVRICHGSQTRSAKS
jgi:ATP-dependent protease ClpP protease subunit